MPLTPAGVFRNEYMCFTNSYVSYTLLLQVYTNDRSWNNETALPQNSNEVIPGGKCKGSILAAYEHNPDWKN